MKAVILVGGEGTRLRPLTCSISKAMVPILNRPFMEHLVTYLSKHNVTDIILAMGYLPDTIQSYLGDGSLFGVKLAYLVEGSPLGTAGAVKNADTFLDDTFIVLNGDILTEIDLTEMIRQHQAAKPKVSIALTPVDNPTIYGVVETDDKGMVKRFVEKPSWGKVTTNMINAGMYILEPDILTYISPETKSMFEYDVFPLMLEKGDPILSYASDAYWIDIGTPEKYLKANHDLLVQQGRENITIAGGSQVHPSVKIEGPVIIGEGCIIAEGVEIKGPTVLGERCQIGKDAILEGVMAWNEARIGEKSLLRNCIICSYSTVQENSRVLDNCVIGAGTTVTNDSVLSEGDRIWLNNYDKGSEKPN